MAGLQAQIAEYLRNKTDLAHRQLTIADVFCYARSDAERWKMRGNCALFRSTSEDARPLQQARDIHTMSYMDLGNTPAHPDENKLDELEQLLLHGTSSQEQSTPDQAVTPISGSPGFPYTTAFSNKDEAEDEEVSMNSDVQGALGLYAEATQDMATAGLELALGRHFACADYCNQAVEKAAQAVSLLHQGHRTMYDHDLRTLGVAVGAPIEVQEDMATLTPFHPEAFYAETPPEEADEVINAEQASEYIQTARRVLRWTRSIIL